MLSDGILFNPETSNRVTGSVESKDGALPFKKGRMDDRVCISYYEEIKRDLCLKFKDNHVVSGSFPAMKANTLKAPPSGPKLMLPNVFKAGSEVRILFEVKDDNISIVKGDLQDMEIISTIVFDDKNRPLAKVEEHIESCKISLDISTYEGLSACLVNLYTVIGMDVGDALYEGTLVSYIEREDVQKFIQKYDLYILANDKIKQKDKDLVQQAISYPKKWIAQAKQGDY